MHEHHYTLDTGDYQARFWLSYNVSVDITPTPLGTQRELVIEDVRLAGKSDDLSVIDYVYQGLVKYHAAQVWPLKPDDLDAVKEFREWVESTVIESAYDEICKELAAKHAHELTPAAVSVSR
ncbi:hypothetical protein [Rubinisphaera brasiliensis]|uniref:Uncharacterized protein n=1 Tax=Rubinisphaera brasiliensis (strain ATCC 49424 / DSM 5305 / JCM 21570 / IAM 15109 / NBRC 103401 / IFAM 1448) TaxID=756272 RepID=F0SNI5_RUBBR|nr:hypothetical protein [Rubinisphaera brasiliensis]ADY57819.1 hypothetical protein Plabr_0189 [Rubinisphaera brasiliensis DSM 5305]